MQNEERLDSETTENTEEIIVEETTTESVDDDTTDWKAEALRQKAINQRLSKKVSKPKIINEESSQIRPSDILRSPEFSLHREGYTEDEIDLIMRNGGREMLKDEKNPLVLGLRAAREQRRAEDEASKANGTSGLGEIGKKYTDQDLRNMSQAELEKILPQA